MDTVNAATNASARLGRAKVGAAEQISTLRPWNASRIQGGLRKYVLIALLDVLVVGLAYEVAALLRFDGSVPRAIEITLAISLLPIAATYVGANLARGIYWRTWHYASVSDGLALVEATALATALVLFFDVLLGTVLRQPQPTRPVPLSIVLAGGVFAFLGLCTTRVLPRIRQQRRTGEPVSYERVLVVGAGHAGQALVRELQHNAQRRYLAVCCVDDDPLKAGMRLRGLPVFGGRHLIPSLVGRYNIDIVAVAIPSAPGHVLRDIVGICQQTTAKIRLVPGVDEVLDPRVQAPMREVTVEDLLGRDPVQIDLAACQAYIGGKTVLLTGAAGSIGSELASQVARLGPAQLVLLDINESGLHDLALRLKAEMPAETSIVPCVGSVERLEFLRRAFAQYQPHCVFHAAANKHVPLMEAQPDQAVLVNIVGTANVCLSAEEHGAERVVLISTDKAVNPANVMGATKRICEELIRAAAAGSIQPRQRPAPNGAATVASPLPGGVCYAAVRFGNVLDSRGSVVPTFMWQIDRGGPVTVTHPDMRRYFMTIPEAVRLVMQAGALASAGDVLLLDMGEEMSIVELAERMITLRGLRPGVDIPITFTGLRPGEKLRESLIVDREEIFPTAHPKISRVVAGPPIPIDDLLMKIGLLHQLALDGELDRLRERLFDLAKQCDTDDPACRPPGGALHRSNGARNGHDALAQPVSATLPDDRLDG